MSRALGLQLVNIKLITYLSTCTPIAERPVVIHEFREEDYYLGAERKVTFKKIRVAMSITVEPCCF